MPPSSISLALVTLIPLISGEAIRQCLCTPYEKCLAAMRDEPLDKCFSRCERIYPTCGFVGCMKQFIPDFSRLKDCSYAKKNGFTGCTSQKSNVLSERSMEDFRDLMISTIEDNVSEFDNTRQFMNKKAARQAECLFECVYPGRNPCTRDLKCDIYLPPEETFFSNFYECAEKKQNFFAKSEQMYSCIVSRYNDPKTAFGVKCALLNSRTSVGCQEFGGAHMQTHYEAIGYTKFGR